MRQNIPFSIRWKSQLIDLSIPKVMGIVNCTPDSFFKSSRIDENNVEEYLDNMVHEGVDILDIGGFSSRPGADLVSVQEEVDRISPVLELCKKNYAHIPVSVDTMRSEVVNALQNYPIAIINDISGGQFDPEIISSVAQIGSAYGIMHMKGIPKTMQENPEYEHDIVFEIIQLLQQQKQLAIDAGIHDIIIDPGFGFGKTLSHNYQILNRLHEFKILNSPILIGVSRKSMIRSVLNIEAEEAENGGTVLHTLGIQKGAHIIRTHDVKSAKETVSLLQAMNQPNLL